MEAAARKVVPKDGETHEQAEQAFSIETCLRQSLLSNELSISHMKIGSLPLHMGETLFLQVKPRLDIVSLHVLCVCRL